MVLEGPKKMALGPKELDPLIPQLKIIRELHLLCDPEPIRRMARALTDPVILELLEYPNATALAEVAQTFL
jgi:hypothetical protein